MKKLTSALLVAVGVVSVAAAQASTNATGFYAGASAGIANTNAKYKADSGAFGFGPAEH